MTEPQLSMRTLSLAAVLACVALSCAAEDPAVHVNTTAQVQALESSLRKQAQAGNGTAIAYLAQYPDYYAELIVRTKSGEVEIHQQLDELMIIVDGDAKLMTGGTPENPHTVRPGELRSSSAPEATPMAMAKGSLIHLRAGMPHQVTVPAQGFVAYIDIKVPAQK